MIVFEDFNLENKKNGQKVLKSLYIDEDNYSQTCKLPWSDFTWVPLVRVVVCVCVDFGKVRLSLPTQFNTHTHTRLDNFIL